MGLGECGLMPEQLGELELRDLVLKLEGCRNGTERIIREMWEAVRLNTFFLVNIQIEKGHRLKSPTQLMLFPWDEEKIPQAPTEEEWQTITNRFE